MIAQQQWPAAAEPLLPQLQPRQGKAALSQSPRRGNESTNEDQAGKPRAGGGGYFFRDVPWLLLLGFAFLTFNSGMALYRAHGDPGAVAFVVFSYADLVALFVCLRRFESAEPGSASRGRLKVAVWLLTTALTLVFSYKVAAVMPLAVAVLVYLMAFGTVAGGFLAFFCFGAKQ